MDAYFLACERAPGVSAECGAVWRFAAPVPSVEELAAEFDRRLDALPRFRQRVVPGGVRRPRWEDDGDFRIERHLEALPSAEPGRQELQKLAGRVFSQRLDMSHSPWKLWVASEAAGGEWALIFKHHHAMADGRSLVYIMEALFDAEDPPEPATRWTSKAAAELRRPRVIARGAAAYAAALLRPADQLPLSGALGSERQISWLPGRLEDLRAVRARLGGTVNDVVLTALSRAVAGWLRERGAATDGTRLSLIVPTSVRGSSQESELGNRMAAARIMVPLDRGALDTLHAVRSATRRAKESHQAIGGWWTAQLQAFVPMPLVPRVSRISTTPRRFHLAVSNLAGPSTALTCLGRRLVEAAAITYLPAGHGMTACFMTQAGRATTTLAVDPSLVPDPERILALLERTFAELRGVPAP
jgi:hypothetical protein